MTKSVPEIENAPESPLTFYRDWIGQNRPVIIRNGIKHWDALEKWKNNEYLIQKCDPDKIVKVAVTPNGYADAITDGKFVMPYEESMTFKGQLISNCPFAFDVFKLTKNNKISVRISALASKIRPNKKK